MRRFLTWMLCLYPLTELMAQPYESVLGEDSISFFSVFHDGDNGFAFGPSHIGRDDTVTMNNLLYYTCHYASIQYTGLRQNGDNSKIWACMGFCDEDDQEMLVMDLNLVEGDSFPVILTDRFDQVRFRDTAWAPVLSVFEVEGRKVIELDYEFYFDSSYYRLQFIEGIGPNAGYLYPRYGRTPMQGFGALLCFEKDGEPLFIHPASDSSCNYNVASTPEPLDEAYQAWWTEGRLFMEVPAGSYALSLSDLQGRQVWSHSAQIADGAAVWEYPLRPSPGIYLLRVSNAHHQAQTFKLQIR